MPALPTSHTIKELDAIISSAKKEGKIKARLMTSRELHMLTTSRLNKYKRAMRRHMPAMRCDCCGEDLDRLYPNNHEEIETRKSLSLPIEAQIALCSAVYNLRTGKTSGNARTIKHSQQPQVVHMPISF